MKQVIRRIHLALLLLVLVNTIMVLWTGGFNLTLGPVHFSTHGAEKSIAFLILLGFSFRLIFIRKLGKEENGSGILGTAVPSSGKIAGVSLLLIAALVFGIYRPTLKAHFLSDDYEFVNLFRQNEVFSAPVLFGYFKNFGVIRPLAVASMAIDYKMVGLDASGYHRTNIILHVLNSFLVFLILFSLRKNVILSALSALLFAAYPVHQETVAWISSRADLLCALFYLLALYFFLSSRRKGPGAAMGYAISLLCFILALGSKEMAMTLPLAIISFDIFSPPRPDLPVRKKIANYIPYILILAGYLIFRISFLGSMGGYVPRQQRLFRLNQDLLFDLRNLLIQPFRSLWTPLHQTMADAYPIIKPLLLSFIVILVVAIAVRKGRNSRLIPLGALITILACLPVFKIFYVSATLQGSRYLYLASIGACLVFYGISESLSGSSRRFPYVFPSGAGIALTALFFFISSFSISHWKEAGDTAKTIVEAGRQSLSSVEDGTRVYVFNLPDSHQGAYLFRNGFPSAMHLAGVSDGIEIVEAWKFPLSKTDEKDHNFAIRWEGGSFRTYDLPSAQLRSWQTKELK